MRDEVAVIVPVRDVNQLRHNRRRRSEAVARAVPASLDRSQNVARDQDSGDTETNHIVPVHTPIVRPVAGEQILHTYQFEEEIYPASNLRVLRFQYGRSLRQ